MINDKKTIRIFADYGGGYMWTDGPYSSSSPISNELEQSFIAWQFQSEMNVGLLRCGGTEEKNADFDWNSFNSQGIELARRLKGELGYEYKVVYEKAFEEDPSQTKENMVLAILP